MLHRHRCLLVGHRVDLRNISRSSIALLHLLQGLVENGRLVRLELPGADTLGEQLVNLFERAALELGDEKEEEEEAAKVGAGPNVAVFGALQMLVVDKYERAMGDVDLPSSDWLG